MKSDRWGYWFLSDNRREHLSNSFEGLTFFFFFFFEICSLLLPDAMGSSEDELPVEQRSAAAGGRQVHHPRVLVRQTDFAPAVNPCSVVDRRPSRPPSTRQTAILTTGRERKIWRQLESIFARSRFTKINPLQTYLLKQNGAKRDQQSCILLMSSREENRPWRIFFNILEYGWKWSGFFVQPFCDTRE